MKEKLNTRQWENIIHYLEQVKKRLIDLRQDVWSFKLNSPERQNADKLARAIYEGYVYQFREANTNSDLESGPKEYQLLFQNLQNEIKEAAEYFGVDVEHPKIPAAFIDGIIEKLGDILAPIKGNFNLAKYPKLLQVHAYRYNKVREKIQMLMQFYGIENGKPETYPPKWDVIRDYIDELDKITGVGLRTVDVPIIDSQEQERIKDEIIDLGLEMNRENDPERKDELQKKIQALKMKVLGSKTKGLKAISRRDR